ncbi:MAG: hypothetical protein ABT03_04190 [Comamonas sp. SCN 67-35]|uniref:DUF2970 domain-containing protein n=1 Tax=unclassified Comamonas TaxID=2638500 RepID=UPI00086F14F6|nr:MULTISPECIES: DUF2970 domain-containing protein [unclassified Comamonas]MBN9330383.1 DUF2970 domain-containing protein [Comamonas sp.]ODU39342.1 MAG: hypothetical protein ABT03_04190 [Comamonas sp. SCN 67-35]OJW96613.1 MAG: hypothetical protein BGO73_04880 [Burkholderiales bacterium 66-26]
MTQPSERGSWQQTLRMVAWSLIGIRNGARHREDQRSVGIVPLMFTALGAVFVFVLALMALVHWIA